MLHTTKGVPQGSVLGPTLILVNIIDVAKNSAIQKSTYMMMNPFLHSIPLHNSVSPPIAQYIHSL